MFRSIAPALAFLMLLLPTSPVLALPAGLTHVTSVEGIDEYRLDNGLSLLLFPDPSKQTTTVNITYLVGSRHEGYGEKGMAHLLEHMLFQGTDDHPDIPTELTAHGARANGTTWTDRTNYYETFAATDENLEWALDLEADRMMNSHVSREDLDSEMTVVRNEFEIGENYPEYVLEERVYSTAFLWHNYGNTTIGARSDIEGVPIDNLRAFYRTWYRPENAVLVVSGQFDADATLALVAEKFGPLANPETPMPAVYTEEPAQDGVRSVTLRRVGDKQIVSLAYHIPSGTHADYAPLDVMAFLLGDEPSGRLYSALVETRKATSVRANADRFRDAGLMYLSSELRVGGDPDDVRGEMIRIVEDFAAPSDEEVERAKTKLLRDWELTLRDSQRAAIRLSEWAALGDWRMMFLHRDRLEAVGAEDVARVAGAYFSESNRTEGTYIPSEGAVRVKVPSSPDVDELLAGYAGREAIAVGEEFDPSPGNVEARSTRFELANGMRVVSLPKRTRGETVNASLELRFGDAESLRGRNVVVDLTAHMLMRGTTSRTRQDIEDEIDRLKASMSLWGWNGTVQASLEATRSTLPDMLRLLADVLRNPSFPESEFAQLREKALQDQEEAKSDPRSLAWNAFSRHLSRWPADDIRYVMTPDEEIAAIEAAELSTLKELHEGFYGGSNAEIAIVGDFDANDVEGLLGELFGDWESPRPFERLVSPYREYEALVTRIQVPDKESVSMSAGMRVEMRDDDPDYPAMVIGNFMTGGGFLASRLAKRIREDDGLSYGVGSWFWASSEDENALFGGYAIYAPQNDEKVVAAWREEMDRILADGFTDDELERAKTGWLQRREVARSRDEGLAATLREQSYLGRTMEWEQELEDAVTAIGTGEILDAFRKHVDLERFCFVRAGDFTAEIAPVAAEEEHASH